MQYIVLATVALVAACLAVYVTKTLRQYWSDRSTKLAEREELKERVRSARRVAERAFENLPDRYKMENELLYAGFALPKGMKAELEDELKPILAAIKSLARRFEVLNGEVICLKESKISQEQNCNFRDEYVEISRLVNFERSQFDLFIASVHSKADSLTARRRKLRLCEIDRKLFALGPVLDRLAARGVTIRTEDSEVCMLRAISEKLNREITSEKMVATFGKHHVKSLEKIAALEDMVLQVQTSLSRKECENIVSPVKQLQTTNVPS
jgi:hypothetical protein